MIMQRLALTLVALALSGCGAGSESAEPTQRRGASGVIGQGALPPSGRSCSQAWNAPENEGNRERVAREGFEVARVGFSRTFSTPPAPGTDGTSEGCGFLFHSDERHLSFGGDWQDGELTNIRPTLEGPWSDAQQRNSADNALVDGEGRVEEVPVPTESVNTVEVPGSPPPAWIQTERGSYWLSYTTFCWRGSGCSDYIVPSCADHRHVRRLNLRTGELVRFHLPFHPNEASLTFYAEQSRGAPDVEHVRLPAERVISWTAERSGAFALTAKPSAFRGSAGYAACIE